MKNIGKTIRRLRKKRGLSQAQICAMSGSSSIAMIESGKDTNPALTTLRGIAKALGVTVQELVGK